MLFGYGVSAQDVLPRPGGDVAEAVDGGQLPVVDVVAPFDRLAKRFARGQARPHEIEHQGSKARIGDVLARHGSDAGTSMRAARAHGDRGGGDRYSESARSGAVTGN